jgi:hypothetical protein
MSFLKMIKNSLNNITRSRPRVDPSIFNDELASKINWSPAKGGGTNMCTHSLRQISPNRVEFRVRGMGILFPGLFMVIGIGVAIGMTVGGLNQDITMLYFGLPFGIIFFCAGFYFFRHWATPRIFDRSIGYYWKGKNEHLVNNIRNLKENCEIRDIYAIQILQEYCQSSSSSGGSSSYYSYELNLVLSNGNRINVIDHGRLSLIRKDAKALSEFLNIPVWDSTLNS